MPPPPKKPPAPKAPAPAPKAPASAPRPPLQSAKNPAPPSRIPIPLPAAVTPPRTPPKGLTTPSSSNPKSITSGTVSSAISNSNKRTAISGTVSSALQTKKPSGAGQKYEENKLSMRPGARPLPPPKKPPTKPPAKPPKKPPKPPIKPPKPPKPQQPSTPAATIPEEPSFPEPPPLPEDPGGYDFPSYDGGYYEPPAPDPAPVDPWITTSAYVPPAGIKQANPDIVLFNDEGISPELLLELEYESLAGMELINISRSDIINGQNVSYSPIKNLSSIRRKYNPNNIISLSELSESFFAKFPIDLVQRGISKPYFDDSGNLIIEIEDVKNGEIIEAEIDTNATIKEVTFI